MTASLMWADDIERRLTTIEENQLRLREKLKELIGNPELIDYGIPSLADPYGDEIRRCPTCMSHHFGDICNKCGSDNS